MIKVEEVTKRFEKDLVLKELNLNINKGSIYGLLGSNGAGKTTLLKIISGIIKANSGKVTIEDKLIFENALLKDKLIFIPDTPYFFSHYTVNQLADFYKNTYSSWNQNRFQQLGKIFKLDPRKKVHRFSKGMQRQVAFWLAFSTMPEVLILDEPFDGLDPVIRKKVKGLIIQDVAEREMTVLISSHNLREVEDICDYIGILHNGGFVLEKDLDDLKSDVHKIQIAFNGDPPEKLIESLNIVHQEKRGSVNIWIVKGDYADVDQEIRSYQPILKDILPLTLEEIFIYEMEGVGYAIENVLV
ncbi:ABC transporter ATP-binding protein [Saliterribacillus persicus]|uniref:ABC-2 type transport system ATP-binding protein n=1 Tax=Saliterribacillus persicus TaxID=930114 RepID=A0A368XXL1_9BACI|nr:ABC transporter ATP-binding protein [Saliterribacillus persicus]RCW71876.1 ABC-2 type transport system ATP-binding protein [Saliterribacillus persicus]